MINKEIESRMIQEFNNRNKCPKCAEKDAEISRFKDCDLIRDFEDMRKERDKLAAKLEAARKAFRDIRDNYDCHCVIGDSIRGAHSCQSCAAKEALKQIGE